MITAPYNFVPLNDKIFYPPWASENILKNIHDVPFEDGESGVIELEVTAKSPIFIKDGKNPSEFCHYINENGGKEYYIPATSIKGMIRNVLEIMSFSAMNFIDDKKYSFRDLKSDEYVKRVANGIYCGWLYKDENGIYKIENCGEPYRLSYEEIEKYFEIENYKDRFMKGKFKDKDDPLKNAFGKYEVVGFDRLQKIYNFIDAGVSCSRKIVKFDDDGILKGKVVLTGHPSGRNESAEKATGKILDFVFLQKDSPEILKVKKEVLENFKFAYFDGRNKQPKESPDWTIWKSKLQRGEKIPVFFHKTGSEVTSFGLSYLYKFPYANSTKTMLDIRQRRAGKVDLSEAIFGYSKKILGKQISLKGRVFISHARAEKISKELKERTMLLGSPKASYYPNYIVQDKKDFKKYKTFDDNAEIAGWKRYPIHKMTGNESMAPSKQTTSIRPLGTESKFKCKIVVHNLLPIELGALLSAITFHQNNLCYHSIGMAKPLGYGKIKLDILNLNGFGKEVKEYLKDFESTMNGEIFDGKIKWHESEQIKNLFSMASEQNDAVNSRLKYMELKDFATSKNNNDSLERYIKFENVNVVQATPLSDQQDILVYRKFASGLREKEKALKEKIELERKKRELQEATSDMDELDKRIYKLKNDPAYKNMPEATALFKAITQTDIFDSIKFEALCRLRKMFKETGKWKEETKQKKPEKDRDYQDTLKIMEMLKEFKK